MMESTVNTFTKGLNRDVSPTKYSQENYFDALNVKLITDNALSSFSITNEKGNTNVFNIPSTQAVYQIELLSPNSANPISITINGVQNTLYVAASVGWTLQTLYSKIVERYTYYISRKDYTIHNQNNKLVIVGLDTTLTVATSGVDADGNQTTSTSIVVPALQYPTIIGSAQLRNNLILFTVGSTVPVNEDAGLPTASNGQIWKLDITDSGLVTDIGLNNYLVPSKHLIYNEALNFSTQHRIEAYGNYETSEVGKVYFTDNYNNFRHFNVLDTDTFSIPLNALSIVTQVKFGDIEIQEINDTGSYTSGMVQYAYQYYNLHGSQSAISKTTGLIHLTKSSEHLATSQFFYGTPTDKLSNKSIKLELSNLDTSFTNIRVFAVLYKTITGTPEISIIKDSTMPLDGFLTIIDGGDIVKGQISDVEFTALGSVNFVCKTFDVKDNILFPANITEEFYDVDEVDGYWDSRAYRWSTAGTSVIGNSNGSTLTLLNTATEVPEDHDCIQTKAIQTSTYKYTKTNKRLGGEGPNIKYYFDTESLTEDSDNTDAMHNRVSSENGVLPNYANGLIQATKTGYMRDEVYRFGICFKDTYGRKSFVKWIADIKMPAVNDVDTMNHTNIKTDFRTFYYEGTKVKISLLSLVFEISNIPASAISFDIVRLKRESKDKTVLAQGILSITNNVTFPGTGSVPMKVPASIQQWTTYNFDKKLFNFISPEVSFNRFNSTSGSGIQTIASLSTVALDTSVPHYFRKAYTYYSYINNFTTKVPTTIIDSRIVSPESSDSNVTINNKKYNNYRYGPAGGGVATLGATKTGFVGTNLLLAVNDTVDVTQFTSSGLPLVNLVRTLSSQYGGNSYVDRFNNKYINCYATQEVKTNTVTSRTYGGDTFINYFDFLYGIYDIQSVQAGYATEKSSCQFLFPVESTINIALRHDKCGTKVDESLYRYLMQETAGTWVTTENGGRTFIQDTDLYLYNHVYSRQDDTVTYFSKPLNFSNNKTFDARILSSDVKHINEEIDSWTSFLATNFVDVDATYGPINKLVTFGKKLLFFQDKAVGWASVNERSLITPDASGTTLSLGKGGILDQYFYISRHSGCRHQFAVIYSPNGVYYYDSANNRINVFTGEDNEPISELKGFSSYLKQMSITGIKKTDTTIAGIGVHGIYDQRFNRILFTFNDSGYADEFTIGYNELLKCFESFYSFKPRLYIKFDDFLYSTNPSVLHKGYLHNSGDYGTFYDNVFDTELEILTNKDSHRVKAITNYEYCLNTAPEELNRNFESVQLRNAYQDSGVVLLTSTNSNKRMRLWRINAPRNFNGDDRIRGEYVRSKFVYNNSSPNVNFVLEQIITHYISGNL